jgi:hypothetical protein
VASASAANPTTAASAGGPAAARSTWTGTYKSAIGTLYIPADWKNVRWSSSSNEKGVGDGTLTLEVDATTGRVTGTIEGVLGPASVDGVALDGKLTATIVRKNASDRGFTGTLLGTLDRDHAAGTMNLSSGQADAIRTATFSLTPAAH